MKVASKTNIAQTNMVSKTAKPRAKAATQPLKSVAKGKTLNVHA